MRPTIEEILETWKKDSIIDESNIIKELIRVPMLHSTYLEHFLYFRREVSLYESKKNKMANIKRKFYRGEMTRDELEKYGWEQFQGLKPSMAELNHLLEIDLDLIALNKMLSDNKTAVSCLEYIINQLKSREFSLKGILDYQKFLSGA